MRPAAAQTCGRHFPQMRPKASGKDGTLFLTSRIVMDTVCKGDNTKSRRRTAIVLLATSCEPKVQRHSTGKPDFLRVLVTVLAPHIWRAATIQWLVGRLTTSPCRGTFGQHLAGFRTFPHGFAAHGRRAGHAPQAAATERAVTGGRFWRADTKNEAPAGFPPGLRPEYAPFAQATMLTMRPGTTMNFRTAAPAKLRCTNSSAMTIASMSAFVRPFWISMLPRCLPLICTG